MSKLPFSAYDFFGYLAAGFAILTAADFAFDGGWIIHGKIEAVGFLTFFWIMFAYVTGQIIANISGYLIEKRFVRGVSFRHACVRRERRPRVEDLVTRFSAELAYPV